MYLFFDTETTGFPNSKLPLNDPSQPHIVQLACVLATATGEETASLNVIVRPDGWTIPLAAQEVHGLSQEYCARYGVEIAAVLELFSELCFGATFVIAHNASFDTKLLEIEYSRIDKPLPLFARTVICTMHATTPVCKLPGRYPGTYKWPRLQEAYKHCFGSDFADAHDALADVRACSKIFFYLKRENLLHLPDLG